MIQAASDKQSFTSRTTKIHIITTDFLTLLNATINNIASNLKHQIVPPVTKVVQTHSLKEAC